jgi:chromosome segregation protein
VYLRSIRLRGFKSFARSTELRLEPGVAVVIGPNGSGKSNLAEAVMWALGEQSPTTMRGASMQDVIFAGSDSRRAAGSAEVELTLDNGDGSLPLPSPEVSLTRRVHRDGQSTYLINRSACRLSDVVDLMSACGLGKEMHSIIGQGRVESLLASKPEDRRALIEEAAGLGRYKRRRERAVLKLREVRRNLERAIDLEREVGAQLTPLRRQASAAEQLRAAGRELDEVRGRLLAGEVETLDGRLAELRGRLRRLDARRAKLDKALVGIAARRTAEEEAFAGAIEERERHAQRVLRGRVLGGRLESCARLTEQRLRLLDEVGRAAAAERDRLLDALGSGDGAQADDGAAERAALKAAGRQAEAAHAETAAALAAGRRTLGERRAELSRVEAERENALLRSARLEERGATLTAEAAELARGCQELERETGAAGRAAGAAAEAAARASEGLDTQVAAAERAAEAERAARESLAAAEGRQHELAAAAAAADAEIAHVGAALAELEDVDESALRVARAFPGTAALSASLTCEPGYEKALGAALARFSGGIAVPAAVDGWSLLEALRRAKVGIVRLILPGRRAASADAAPAGAEPLADRVGGAPPWLRDVLSDTVVVDDLRAVPDDFAGLAVTRDGAYYRPAEGQLGLAAGLPAAVLLERRAHLEASVRRREALRTELSAAAAEAGRVRAEAQGAAAEQARCARAAQEARGAAERAQRDAGRAEAALRELGSRLERDRRGREAHLSEAADLGAELERLQTRAAELLVRAEQLAVPLTAAETALLELEERHEHTLTALTRARVELEQREAAQRRRAEEREQAGRRSAEGRRRLAELEERLAVLPAVQEVSGALLAACAALQERAQALGERLSAASPAGGRADVDRAGLRRLAEEEAAARRESDDIGQQRAALQVEAAHLEERRAETAAACEHVAGRLEVARFAPPADEQEADGLRRAVEQLEQRRLRIGPVNPLAEGECAALGERAAFLREQRRDLERSVEKLNELIAQLTERIDDDFAATFRTVEAQFSHMIETLFPGGQGRLTLVKGVGEDAADGVAIEVKPDRKLGKKLSMLSGGERALAAIAFLMALVLAEPSPFYILDEIEAALDDVNIGRFVSLVREYRERTQFIIITHQKRTMEAADILYGVTMGQDGASHVVSARMAEQEIDREAEAS